MEPYGKPQPAISIKVIVRAGHEAAGTVVVVGGRGPHLMVGGDLKNVTPCPISAVAPAIVGGGVVEVMPRRDMFQVGFPKSSQFVPFQRKFEPLGEQFATGIVVVVVVVGDGPLPQVDPRRSPERVPVRLIFAEPGASVSLPSQLKSNFTSVPPKL